METERKNLPFGHIERKWKKVKEKRKKLWVWKIEMEKRKTINKFYAF